MSISTRTTAAHTSVRRPAVSRPAAVAAAQSAAKVPNYARRRATAVLLVVIALLALAFNMIQPQAAGASAKTSRAHLNYIYVESGDTLWSIATKFAPQADPQQEIIDIQNLNGLDGSQLEPGQRLALP